MRSYDVSIAQISGGSPRLTPKQWAAGEGRAANFPTWLFCENPLPKCLEPDAHFLTSQQSALAGWWGVFSLAYGGCRQIPSQSPSLFCHPLPLLSPPYPLANFSYHTFEKVFASLTNPPQSEFVLMMSPRVITGAANDPHLYPRLWLTCSILFSVTLSTTGSPPALGFITF